MPAGAGSPTAARAEMLAREFPTDISVLHGVFAASGIGT